MPGGLWTSALSTSARADLEHAELVRTRDRQAFDDHLEPVAAAQGERTELLLEQLRDVAEVDRSVLDPHPAGIEPREVEQIGCELRQPRHLLAHRLQEFLAGRLVQVFVRHQLEEAAEREQRRAQLVGGVRDELSPGSVEVLEPSAHALDRGCELAELVSALVDDRLFEATGGDPLDGALEPADPARVHRRSPVADDEREDEADQAGDQQPPLDEMEARKRVDERIAEQHDGVCRAHRYGDLRESALAPLDRSTLGNSG